MTDGLRGAAPWLVVFALAACGGRGSGTGSTPAPAWLRATGFEGRAEWPSTLLHLRRAETLSAGRLSVLLRDVPGLTIRNPQGESWGVYRELPEGGRCSVSLVMNGAFVSRRTLGGDWNLDFLVQIRDLHGVELHVGEEGPLIDESGCGILMLWSERSRLDAPGVERRLAEADVPFRGSVTGAFWGEGADSVVEVRLEPGGQTGDFDNDGNFVFRSVLPGAYDIVIATADGPVARYPVRVYAYADSWIDAPIERGFEAGPQPPVAGSNRTTSVSAPPRPSIAR